MSDTINYINPKLIADTGQTDPSQVSWRSPSNLAIIKYWGKHGQQLPRNPSISLTLSAAHTETELGYVPKASPDTGIDLEFYFDGQPNEVFAAKVKAFLESLHEVFPFLRQFKLLIRSRNSFPHSAGIASSASAMSALSLCLCSMEHRLFGTLENDDDFRKKASYLSRLGSGSACRSVFATMALWGATGEVPGSSDLYAVPYTDGLHPLFATLHDDILIVSKSEKAVSSRAGHGLMEGNIYADNRYAEARRRMHQLLGALRTGDMEAFGRIAEAEALTLHALMMMSTPPFLLIKPNTLLLIDKIHDYRARTGQPLYFSLDAGPNLHLLYPDEAKVDIQRFIREELSIHCEGGQYIQDQAGEGPRQLA